MVLAGILGTDEITVSLTFHKPGFAMVGLAILVGIAIVATIAGRRNAAAYRRDPSLAS